jgi:hypothetical protein
MILDSNAISDWWQGRPALLVVLEKVAAEALTRAPRAGATLHLRARA